MLTKSKLNSIETLISQALIDLDISHGEFNRILKRIYHYEDKDDNETMDQNKKKRNSEKKEW